jgi:hypothetical protein
MEQAYHEKTRCRSGISWLVHKMFNHSLLRRCYALVFDRLSLISRFFPGGWGQTPQQRDFKRDNPATRVTKFREASSGRFLQPAGRAVDRSALRDKQIVVVALSRGGPSEDEAPAVYASDGIVGF